MVKKIELSNGRTWATQKAALAHFKEMLARYKDNETVEVREDHDDLLALLERYDEAITDDPSKIGVGVEVFFRRRNIGEGYSTASFWVRRTDGTETDFSYIHAVKGEPKGIAREFYDACRSAVAADLLTAKKRQFDKHGDASGRIRCEITNELISFEEAQLDHAYPTFGQLVVSFRAAKEWQHSVPADVLSLAQDAQTRTTFLDPSVAEAFRSFHHAAALLRIVCRKGNLGMAAGQRKPKVKRPVTI